MAYTDDAVQAKLSALNETQESIVTVAQWVMFHRRYADRTAASWLQRIKDSGSNKRLNLIYLANEVAQQSRMRKKDDFIVAFSPVLSEATATAYKGASYEIQQKVRRVVENKSSGRRLGGSLLSSSGSAPKELQPIVTQQIALNKATAATTNATQTANSEYDKLTDPSKSVPTPPVHAARLSALLKQLASAEIAVNESIKARKTLIEGMEKLVETNKAALAQDESSHFEFVSRKTTMEAKRRDVEDSIMRGLSNDDGSPTPNGGPSNGVSTTNGTTTPGHDGSVEPERPQPEELTPPPVESFTPTGSPKAEAAVIPHDAAPHLKHTHPDARGPPVPPPLFSPKAAPPSAALNSPDGVAISPSTVRAHSGSPGSSGGPAKRRRLDDEYAGFGSGDAMADLDDDVAELLRSESGGK